MPVARRPYAAEQAIEIDERKAALDLLRRNDLHFHAEHLGLGNGAAELDHLLGPGDEADGAGLVEADGLAGILLELPEEIGCLLMQPRLQGARAVVHELTRRVPRRAGGELVLLDEDDVFEAELRQVIGKAAAGDAAADDGNLRM